MKMSNLFYTAQKETPAEAEIPSHQLMIRAGLIRKVSSGIYSFLPLGMKALQNVERIIREEMNEKDAQEILMPALLPAEPYKKTGRWDKYGKEMFKLEDRNGKEYGLGPTHEEFFTDLIKSEIKSYKKLPVNLYQIQHKYRDEMRPRFGLMRTREFIMKDAYSFDKDAAGLDESYEKMRIAYNNIFTRCGLDYLVVEADSGAIGGSNSQEFMAKSEYGEDNIAFCKKCGYSANIEKAECICDEIQNDEEKAIEEIYTPNVGTISDLEKFEGIQPEKMTKTIIYVIDEKPVIAMIRGNREINEVKLLNLVGGDEIALASNELVEEITGAKVGFAGPINLKKQIPIYVDNEILTMKNFLVGANKSDYHFINVNVKDFEYTKTADLRNIEKGDKCPKCKNEIDIIKGIEIGHIFKLGTAYSETLECTYIDENGKDVNMLMGCYGIGVTRVLPAIIEQNRDEKGIIWPIEIAPYKVSIVPISIDNEIQKELAEEIYQKLTKAGIEVMLDDRKERPGVKFNDTELLGIPYRITVGREAQNGIIELCERRTGNNENKNKDEAIEILIDKLGKIC